MQYTTHYTSPLGDILMAADEQGLTGLWFDQEKYYAQNLDPVHEEIGEAETQGGSAHAGASAACGIFREAFRWLDQYFKGEEPDFLPPLHPLGSDFQKEVWDILLTIPYGKTTTYGEIAKQIAARRGLARMSAQAVGGAVGRNEISIIIPCHRVVGTGGSLTGYAGGIDKKVWLLEKEGADMRGFFVPKKGTAL